MSIRWTVLAYHAIGQCPPADDLNNLFVATEAFEAQMAHLARRRRVVPLDAVVEQRLRPGPPVVAITFDDAYRSVLTEAAPVLGRFGFPATVFVPTAFVGDRNRWDPPTACPLEIMTADELRECDALGIRPESHGHAHMDMRVAAPEAAKEDLERSRARLVAITGRQPEYLAWPFDTGSQEARDVAASVGFRAAFSIDRPHEGAYAMARVPVTPLDGKRLFSLKTSGRYLALRHSAVLSRAYSVARPLAEAVRGRA